MSQARFVEKHASTWRRFETLLDELERDHPAQPAEPFPELYRTLCQHLSIARHRGYSATVVDRLNPLVERGHALLYGSRAGNWAPVWEYLAGGFARDVRRDWHLLAIAALLFVGPYVGMIAWLHFEPQWAYHILGDQMVTQMEEMYRSAEATRAERQSDSDLMMFGFYIYNNIGIALRTFGSGLLAGVGAFFILIYNGVVLGAVSGHLQNVGLGHNFWPFVVGHGSFELTAIVLAGQAGLKLGFAPIWPGRRSRLRALIEEARDSLGLVGGFFVMLVIAAFIEAFWSSAPLDDPVKYGVGAALWLFVIGYFLLAGRR
ncbi:MAG: stage II sporulation protein M [Persicimonas sp.]